MKHMGLTAALTLAILAGASVSDANAQGGQKGPRMSFEEVDANADGKLTPDEMQAHRRAQMAKMDSDTDGFLTEAELRAGDYYGSTVNRAARIMSIGHGGQVLLSGTTADLLHDSLPAEVRLLDLGRQRLKGLNRPARIFQARTTRAQ